MPMPSKKSPYEPKKTRNPIKEYALSPVIFAVPLVTNPNRPDVPGHHLIRHMHEDLTIG